VGALLEARAFHPGRTARSHLAALAASNRIPGARADEVPATVGLAGRGPSGLGSLTTREREVLSLMAEGRSNAALAAELVVSPGAVERHVAGIFAKLGPPSSGSGNRRVLAVLRYRGA
jgi:DNA-binding NarL/FixJ family response regulator